VIKNSDVILEAKNLKTYFHLDEGTLKAVDGVSFKIKEGKTMGLVGESGCGKSVTAYSLLKIIPPEASGSGEVLLRRKIKPGTYEVIDIMKMDIRGKAIREIRGKEISMIFQEPMTSLSPVHSVGNQILEAIYLHKTKGKKQARELALEILKKVGVANPAQTIEDYPHHLSGGMRQRAMIAMALCSHPALLIADEPTTSLDVTVQAQVLDLMKSLQAEFGMSILFITHDLGVIAEMTDVVTVMYLGKIVECGTVGDIFDEPLHPYTQALLKSIPQVGAKAKSPLQAIQGSVPVPLDFPIMCPFFSRCSQARQGMCDTAFPPETLIKNEHRVSCFLYSS
jgi:peptide/nickel transport system ATP-binding protein